jgi:hypothetical protein
MNLRVSKVVKRGGALMMNSLIPLLTFVPLIVLVFVVRWVYQIKKNSEIQVE